MSFEKEGGQQQSDNPLFSPPDSGSMFAEPLTSTISIAKIDEDGQMTNSIDHNKLHSVMSQSSKPSIYTAELATGSKQLTS